MQEDTELDDQVRLMDGPEGSIQVVQLQRNQLSLKLWEPLCVDNPNPAGPPLLLMPPDYEWLDPENGPRELAELMYIGQRVGSGLTFNSTKTYNVEKCLKPCGPSTAAYGPPESMARS
jgi:hypothetical protein